MKEELTSLLNIISSINEKYEEIFRITGEKFNIFEALKLTHKEWAHSRVLAELLDPKGSHGKGNLFLEKFLEIVAEKHKTCAKTDEDKGKVGKEFIIEGAIIQEEKPIDNGRPDIIITNKNGEKIILENKIWAEERDKQLEGYSKENPIHLIFLTPYGKKAEKIGEGKFGYIKMSYKKDILEWLELCKKESVDNPILRETLTQYILLIRQLTGQTRSKDMEDDDINAIIKNSKYVSAAFDIAGSIEAMKKRIVEEVIFPPLDKIAKEEGFKKFETDLHFKIDLYGKDSYFSGWNFDIWLYKWKHLAICLKFLGVRNGFGYGILSEEHKALKDSWFNDKLKVVYEALKREELKKIVDEVKFDIKEEGGHSWFLLYKEKTSSLWKEWGTEEFFAEVISENGMKEMERDFRKIIGQLSEIGNRLEEKLK